MSLGNYLVLAETTNNIKKATQLPFIIRKAPIENSVAYEKKGHWTQKEKLKYAIFLQYHRQKFTVKDSKKRFCKIFKVMSDFIKTRTHNQCRSHHQKMEKERFQVDSIIKNVTSKYHPRVYHQHYQRYLTQIQNLRIEEIQQNIPSPKIDKPLHTKSLQKNILKSDGKISFSLQQLQQNSSPEKVEKKHQIKIKDSNLHNKQQTQKNNRRTKDSYAQQELLRDQQQEDIPYEFGTQQIQGADGHHSSQGFKFNHSMDIPIPEIKEFYPTSVEVLQAQKLNCIQKAVFHQNQMQYYLNSASECQRAKNKLLGNENEDANRPEIPPFYFYPTMGWEYGNNNKPF